MTLLTQHITIRDNSVSFAWANIIICKLYKTVYDATKGNPSYKRFMTNFLKVYIQNKIWIDLDKGPYV